MRAMSHEMQSLPLTEIECLWAAGARLGEGLAFDARTNRLWFVDIATSRLFSFGLGDGARKSWPLPTQVTALAIPSEQWVSPLNGDPNLLCVGKKGYCWLAIQGDQTRIEEIIDPEADIPENRFNDGKIGPGGRFYAGTMDDGEIAVRGALYSLGSTGELKKLDDQFAITNGPAFSPDGKTLYENDSKLRRTYSYDFAPDGRLSGKRLLHQFSESDGFPDGMTTDRFGNLWIAMWDGGKIQRLNTKGEKTGFIEAPVQRPTNCLFSSDNELIFVSAAGGVTVPSANDGGLFRVRLRSS